MNAIRIRKQITSDTLRLPELKPFMGKRVEIIVLDDARSDRDVPRKRISLKPPPHSIPPCKTIDEVAAEQGVSLKPIEQMLGGWPADELDDGFEETLREWRQEELTEVLKIERLGTRRRKKKSR